MKVFVAFFLITALQTSSVKAQEIPSFTVTDADGKLFKTTMLNENDNKVKVLSFWATWCVPCINELSTINDLTTSWKKDLEYDFYAISLDDSRSAKKVSSLVNGKGWEFAILLDKNQDFKRLLNLPGVPYTLIVKNGKIVYRHLGYVEGDEQKLYDVIKANQ